jgi:hypothetical protein
MPLLDILLAVVLVGALGWFINVRVPIAGGSRTIVNVVLMLILVGSALWLINTYIPMAGSIKAILNIVVVVATVVRILQVFGLWGGAVGMWTRFTSHRPADSAKVPSPESASKL